MRKCSFCQQEKDESQFYVNRTAKSGYQTRCIPCSNKGHRGRDPEKMYECAYCRLEFIRSRPDQNSEKWCSDYCRVMDKIDVRGADECWPWKARSRHFFGYGMINMRGKVIPSNRATWSVMFGDPGAMHVLHSCDNPACCNPLHLRLGTDLDNKRDMNSKGRHGMLGSKLTEEHRLKMLNARRRKAERELFES